jgi:hypothetical protein
MNVFEEIVSFFTTGRGMSPAASWTLMAFIPVAAILLTLIFVEIEKLVDLAIWNVKIAGPIGIWWAFLGSEAYEIRRRQVISVAKRKDGCYLVRTTDGEDQEKYVIVPLDTDDSEAFQLAKDLSGNDKKLFDALCPDSRVRGTFKLKDNRNRKTTVCYLVFLKYFNEHEVEETMQEYFDEQFRKECRDARRSHHKEVTAA